jgi:hypothetical protein
MMSIALALFFWALDFLAIDQLISTSQTLADFSVEVPSASQARG